MLYDKNLMSAHNILQLFNWHCAIMKIRLLGLYCRFAMEDNTMKYSGLLLAISLILLLALAIGCTAPTSTPSTPTPSSVAPTSTPSNPTPTLGTPTSTPSTPPPSSAATAGELADMGKTVYANSCARCHGANGEGVSAKALIGPNAKLAKYGTAQGLLNFISKSMPFNAPGSLSPQQYLQVLSYILIQNNYVSPGTSLDASTLSGINLK
jgi:mono/diheme cytochrome c family protein